MSVARIVVRGALAGVVVLGLSLLSGCVYGYRRAYEAATSPLSAPAQAQDIQEKVELRRVLLENQRSASLTLTAEVFMQQACVAGFVDDPEQAQAVLVAAHRVAGLRAVHSYLPTRVPDQNVTGDLEIKADIKAQIAVAPALVSDRYTVDVLGGVVVLCGVVWTPEEREAVAQIAHGASGVTGIRNLLLIVEPEYQSLRPHLR